MKIHLIDDPFECDICGKSFSIYLLWKHIRRFITKKNHSNAIFVIKHFTKHERISTKKGNHSNVDFVLKHSLLIWKYTKKTIVNVLFVKNLKNLYLLWNSLEGKKSLTHYSHGIQRFHYKKDSFSREKIFHCDVCDEDFFSIMF